MSSSAAKKIQKVVRGRKGRADAEEKKRQRDMQYELNRQHEIELSRYSDMYGYTSSWRPRHQVNKRINWKAIALQCLSTMKNDSHKQRILQNMHNKYAPGGIGYLNAERNFHSHSQTSSKRTGASSKRKPSSTQSKRTAASKPPTWNEWKTTGGRKFLVPLP